MRGMGECIGPLGAGCGSGMVVGSTPYWEGRIRDGLEDKSELLGALGDAGAFLGCQPCKRSQLVANCGGRFHRRRRGQAELALGWQGTLVGLRHPGVAFERCTAGTFFRSSV